jgi:WS/DGAT/MGAT family acyltransferase
MKSIRDTASGSIRSVTRPNQLSDRDAVFISVERPEAPSHIAALSILDPSQCAEFSFERFVEILGERIDSVERFKWKLYEPPLGIDRAYWVEDEEFDVARHVERVALPEPGDRAALARVVAFLHAQSLDRTRPLWESWWIEGLAGDRVAMLMKVHHCLMDGQSGIGLAEILMDLSPEPRRSAASSDERPREAPPRRPALWEMGRAALSNSLRIPQAVAVHSRRALTEGLNRTLKSRSSQAPPPVPRVHFNGRLSRQRSFSFATVPLGPLRDAKKHFDVKMNDILLEIVSSALRRGLLSQGRLPAEAIVGLCPVSLRERGDQSFGNQISSMPVSLATDIEDLPGRLAAIHESAEAAKRRLEEGAFETFAALGECLSPGVLKFLTGVAHAVPSMIPIPANLVVSNVRGLPVPMYLAGARVDEVYPLSMLQVANGMNVTAVSHDDQVDFGFLVDSGLISDPWIYAEGVHAAVRELEEYVEEHTRARGSDQALAPAPSVVPTPTPEPPAASTQTAEAGSDDSPLACQVDPEPLDLHLMMSRLSHIRAPSRDEGTSDEGTTGEGDVLDS